MANNYATTLEGAPTLVTEASLRHVDTSSIYDSLLRGVAAGNSDVQVDAAVGPNGKFVLQQEIGSGGMGRVYRAFDRYLLRDVAIKFIFRPDGMDVETFTALFWHEARILARLDQHDSIVRMFDVDHSTYPPFIVMEYLEGQSLEDLLNAGPIALQTVLRIMISVTRGLQEAHAKGVYHRDLKPSNIFVQNTGRVKLLDFGLAHLCCHLGGHLTERSMAEVRSGARPVPPLPAAGTPAYMAPEQWRGEEADATTDIWAIGAILYRLLANSPPFAADSLAALSARVLSGEPPPALATLCSEAPVALRELVARLLRVDRIERPRAASEVTAALVSVLRTMLGGRRQAPLAPAASPRWASRSPRLRSNGGPMIAPLSCCDPAARHIVARMPLRAGGTPGDAPMKPARQVRCRTGRSGVTPARPPERP